MLSKYQIKNFIKGLRQEISLSSDTAFRETVLAIFAAKYLLDNDRISYKVLKDAGFCKSPSLSRCFKTWRQAPLPATHHWEQHQPVKLTEKTEMIVCAFLNNGHALMPLDDLLMLYPEYLSQKTCKQQGIFYTPKCLANLMVRAFDDDLKLQKIIDPACGAGMLLLATYQKMRREGFSHEACLKTLWGVDNDPFAVLMTKCVLTLQGQTYDYPPHIYQKNALFDLTQLGNKFDAVIANPPYVGHKQITVDAMSQLRAAYPEVYADKGNLMHCFFALAASLLKAGGRAVFLTTRYYTDAANARNLRGYLMQHFHVLKIIDYHGRRVIPGVGIDPMITVLEKKENKQQQARASTVLRYNIDHDDFQIFHAKLNGESWCLRTPEENQLLQMIETRTDVVSLSDVASSYQGVITGCDAAFVKNAETIVELPCVRTYPWLKNSDIDCFQIRKPQKCVLAFETLTTENQTYLAPYERRLKNRRECQKGRIRWWEWQWSRRADFDRAKIVFPYKAEKNRFAIDREGRRFSADIYALQSDVIPLEALCVLLNTPLYDAYYKIIAKKLGERLYEYYPNQVMQLKIPSADMAIYCKLQNLYDIIMIPFEQADWHDGLYEANRLICEWFGIENKQRTSIENAYTKHFF